MPKYKFPLTNGKTLVLEGSTQPSDADAEAAAKEQGVELMLADESNKPAPARPLENMGVRPAGGYSVKEGPEGAVSSTIRGMVSPSPGQKLAQDVLPLAGGFANELGAQKLPSGPPGGVLPAAVRMTPGLVKQGANAAADVIEKHPVASSLAGAAVGAVYPGGPMGMLEGAAGGGALPRAIRFLRGPKTPEPSLKDLNIAAGANTGLAPGAARLGMGGPATGPANKPLAGLEPHPVRAPSVFDTQTKGRFTSPTQGPPRQPTPAEVGQADVGAFRTGAGLPIKDPNAISEELSPMEKQLASMQVLEPPTGPPSAGILPHGPEIKVDPASLDKLGMTLNEKQMMDTHFKFLEMMKGKGAMDINEVSDEIAGRYRNESPAR